MAETGSFSQQAARNSQAMTAAERRVVAYISANRESAIMASAVVLARAAKTSDATVIRTAKRLGFGGLEGMRHALAMDLRSDLTLAERLSSSLAEVDGKPASILTKIVAIQRAALDGMEAGIAPAEFEAFLTQICGAGRKLVFGIGPSGHLAGYFAQQLVRLGADALALGNTGLKFADDLVQMRAGDVVIALAYDRPYPEITALFDRAIELGIPRLLITAPGPLVPDERADVCLHVPRGQSDGFSLHAATLALIEVLVVGYAGRNRLDVLQALENLNGFRRSLAGDALDL